MDPSDRYTQQPARQMVIDRPAVTFTPRCSPGRVWNCGILGGRGYPLYGKPLVRWD